MGSGGLLEVHDTGMSSVATVSINPGDDAATIQSGLNSSFS